MLNTRIHDIIHALEPLQVLNRPWYSDPNIWIALASVITLFFSFLTIKLALDQRELAILPLLGLYFRSKPKSDGSTEYKIRIRNLGKGAAVNICIEPILLIFKTNSAKDTYRIILEITAPNYLVESEERDLLQRVEKNGKMMTNYDMQAYLNPEFANHDSPIQLSFENALGEKYESTILTGKSGISIIMPPHKNDLLHKLTNWL